mmetsp:Transcript_115195/g.229457  ORF Transcript_115195/g.229457 Transcript_115195/m.229457 type:complete len:126 (+) Transcript_115195:39-416(+)
MARTTPPQPLISGWRPRQRALGLLLCAAFVMLPAWPAFFFGGNAASEKPLETYVALTKINVREMCDVQSAKTGRIIEQGEKFQVQGSGAVGPQRFFKLADGPGWVFQRGVAGRWLDKDIIALVEE